MIPVGQCVASQEVGKLKCKNLIHVVGPNLCESQAGFNQDKLLAFSMQHILDMACDLELESISIPAISCGKFGYPTRACAQILYESTIEYLRWHPETTLKNIRFVNRNPLSTEVFYQEFTRTFQEWWKKNKKTVNFPRWIMTIYMLECKTSDCDITINTIVNLKIIKNLKI